MRFERDDCEAERASSAVHAAAFLGAAVLLTWTGDFAPVEKRGALGVFALAMVLMFLSSALFHAWPAGAHKHSLERLDRAVIFLFIAASYSLFSRAGPHTLTVAVWSLAACGALVSVIRPPRRPLLVVLPYLLLGWLCVVAIAVQASSMSRLALCLLVAGALVYTAGLRHFMASTHRLAHVAWHVFVVAGSGLHTAAALV